MKIQFLLVILVVVCRSAVAESFYAPNSMYPDLKENPETYKGKEVAFEGMIIEFTDSGKSKPYFKNKMPKPELAELWAAMLFNPGKGIGIKKGDIDRVFGYFQSFDKGLNAIGSNKSGYHCELGQSFANLGAANWAKNDFDKATAYLKKALEPSPNISAELESDMNMAAIYETQGDFKKAINLNRFIIEKSQELGLIQDEVYGLTNMGRLKLKLGKPNEALKFFNVAHRVHSLLRDVRGHIVIITYLAKTHFTMGEFDKSLSNYEQSLQLALEIADRRSELLALTGIGKCYLQLEYRNKAKEVITKGLSLAQDLGNKVSEKELKDLLNKMEQGSKDR